jgi:hypothetical protein
VKTIVCLFGLSLIASQVSSEDALGGGIWASAVPIDYKGPCPVTAHFRVTIGYGLAHAKVRYHWERNDGKMTPQQSGEILDGRLNVGDDFAVGEPENSFEATDRLHFSINGAEPEIVSVKLKSTGTCTR